MKKYLFTLLCAALVLAGCSNIMGPAHNNNAKKEGLKITVSNNTAGSRTVFPKLSANDFIRYDLSFENTDGTETHPVVEIEKGSEYVVVKDLLPGTWKITAKGIVLINGTEYPAADGTATVTVTDDEYPDGVTIDVSAKQAGADGFFSYNVSLPGVFDAASGDSATLTISTWGDPSDLQTIDLLDANISAAAIPLTPGYKLLTIKLIRGGEIAGLSEIVHIYSNVETAGEFAFTDTDFTSYITLGGTIKASYAGGPVYKLVIDIGNDTIGWIDQVILSPTTTETPWSVKLASFDTPTDIWFQVSGSNADGEEVYSNTFTTAAQGVTNQDKTDIVLTVANDIPRLLSINYGTPTLTDPSDAEFIDPIWNDVEGTPINKPNPSEFTGANLDQDRKDFIENPHTTGTAKLLWDESGLWLYVDVATEFITADVNATYDGSSVELFVNEGYPTVTSGAYDNIGGQYRLDPYGKTSGDPAGATTAFNNLNRKNAFVKTDGSGNKTGYVVIFQAPWRFKNNYPLKDNKNISIEIQINAARKSDTSKAGRDGVVKWFDTQGSAYQHAEFLAKAILKFDGTNWPSDVWDPIITAPPAGFSVNVDDAEIPALTVSAVSPDRGDLTYQWYKVDDATGANPNPITGATDASFTPTDSVAAATSYFYRVEVTNTRGASSKTVQSAVVEVKVIEKAKVTFDANGGESEELPLVVEAGLKGVGTLPNAPTWGGAYTKFDGWNTNPNGTGTAFTATTPVTADITVYAKWKYVGGPIENVGDTLVHTRPALVSGGNNITVNADGTIRITNNSNYGASYQFPAEAYESDGTTLKYDFFRIDYTISDYADTWQYTQVNMRKYNTNTAINSETSGRWSSAFNYITLTNQQYLIYDTAMGSGGFTITGAQTNTAVTLTITSITFYVAPKFNVTFDINYEGGTNPSPVSNVWGPLAGHPGYSLGTLPVVPDRTTETPPYFFVGWYDETVDPPVNYAGTTVITKDVTLTAYWTNVEPPKVEKITSSNDVAAPIYRFDVDEGIKWSNITSITYTIYVDSGNMNGDSRQFVIGSITESSFNTNNDYRNGLVQNANWGGMRLMVEDNQRLGVIAGNQSNKWVTKTVVINPPPNAAYGNDVGSITKLDANSDLRTYYFALPFGVRSSSAAFTYYIKDVALVTNLDIDNDGTSNDLIPCVPFYDDKGYFGPDHPTVTTAPGIKTNSNVLLRNLSFRSNAGTTAVITREMAYTP